MNDLLVTTLLIASLFLILGSGVWIGLTLSGVAWIGMQLFSSRPAGVLIHRLAAEPKRAVNLSQPVCGGEVTTRYTSCVNSVRDSTPSS